MKNQTVSRRVPKIVPAILLWLKSHHRSLLIILFFFIYSTVLTWPFAAHPLSTQTSTKYGDNFSSIVKFQTLKDEGKNPFVDGHIDTIAYPDGLRSNVGVDRVSFFSTLLLWGATLVANSFFAHGLLTFLGFFITASITYFFLRTYLKSEKYAVLGAIIYTSFPLFIALEHAAPVYMHMWVYILPLWACMRLVHDSSRKNVLLAVISIIPGVFWTPYFFLHTLLVALASIAAYTLTVWRRDHKIPIHILVVSILSTLTICASYFVIGHSTHYASVPDRPITDAYEQSLSPGMLALPTADVWWAKPIYHSVIVPLMPRSNESSLYLGLAVIIFAAIGVYALILRRIKDGHIYLLALFALLLLVITLSFSLAPTINIFGIKVPTPNYFVVHLVPALRAGQRLVGPLMLSFVLLALVGIWQINQHSKLREHSRTVFFILATIILIDITTAPFTRSALRVSRPATMIQLSTMKKGVTAEFMNDSLLGYPGQLACKNLLVHHMQTVNSCGLDIYTAPGKWPTIEAVAKLDVPQQISTLKDMGVRYIILDHTSPQVRNHLTSLHITLVSSDDIYAIYRF